MVALSLRFYTDYVINGDPSQIWNFYDHTIYVQSFCAAVIPFGIVAFAAFQGFLKYVNFYLTNWVGNKISNALKVDLFKKLTSMDPQFYDVNSSGMVLSRFLSDPETASRNVINSLETLITAFCGVIGLAFVLLFNSWKLAVIGLVIMGAAITPVTFIRKKIKSASNENIVVGGDMTTNFNETFGGNKIMSAYNLQDARNNMFQSQINQQFGINMSLAKRVGWMSPIMYTVCAVGIALVLKYGTHLVLSGQLSAGGLISFVTSLLLLYKPVKTLGNTLTQIQGVFVSMGRVFELFDLAPVITAQPNAPKMQGLQNNIEFQNVSFEYEKGTPVLKNINLTVQKNEMIALVGNSGGGKSTLVNLLPRFYDVTQGKIEFDGEDIRNLDLVSLRENISFVFQDNFLFTGTIRDNILMGNKNAADDDLASVIKMAHLDEFLEDVGIDAPVGERGASLSGGQRQRVAIARAMLKDAPIIVLDEATSALDNKSEAVVQKALDNLMADKTVFVIAHRLSTIKNADRIAVINEGELVELGTHDELMNIPDGSYKNLYNMQFSKGNF